MPSTVAMAAGTEAGSPTDASSTIHTPSGNSPATSAPTSSASRVLPTPPTPLSVTSRFDRTSSATSATSVLAADERAQLLREVAREVVDAAQHGELRRESVGDDLVHRHPSAQAAEPVLTERPQRHAVAQQHLGRVGHEHLTAVGERHQPRRAVHLAAEVVPVAFDRLTGVQAHAHREVDGGVVAQLLLRLDRRRRRVGGGRERGAEAVAAGAEHVAAVAFDRAPHDGVVDPQRVGHVGRGFLPQTRGVLDVGEQEGHRAPRKPARHARTVMQRLDFPIGIRRSSEWRRRAPSRATRARCGRPQSHALDPGP